MKNGQSRKTAAICALGLLVLLGGCHRKRKTRSAPKSSEYADKLKPIVESRRLQVLHWPNFSDYEPLVQTFYDDRNYEVAWVDDNNGPRPSPQALAFIQAFQDAANKGLNPEDYNASRWPDLVRKLAGKNDDDVAQFDAAMTVSVMRYISDLRIGRVNPTHFNFDIHTQDKKYDLPEFVSDNAVDATDVPKLIRSVEPDSDQYRRTEDALAHYLDLAKQQAASPELAQPLPAVAKPIAPGGSYPAADALQARLQLEGDLAGGAPAAADTPASASAPQPEEPEPTTRTGAAKASLGKALGKVEADVRSHTRKPATVAQPASQPATPQHTASTAYTQELAEGVSHFQARHGLTADGKLTPATITELNVPLSDRVKQLDDSLERWRWLPNEYVNAPLMVNLPEFVLRGFSGDNHALDFTMKVVVGKVVGDHDTPVFTHMMKYLIFRPYWNVPTSIVKKELTGHIQKSGVGYLASHNFETTDSAGHVVNASAEQVEHFGVNVREKPGPKNSLGLVKFMFPNEYDIYLHSTPQPELFERSRRDFSHGCVRVQKPADLAVWVLHRGGVDDWDMEKVQDAMNNGPDNHQINLKQEIPIVIFYLTANVGEDGQVHFFDDLYGYDKELDAVLAKGMPYPSTQQKVNPKASPEGTD
jgi:murein L,D-transpeptidase YcbB/YkuD